MHIMIICKFNKWQTNFLILRFFWIIALNNWVKVIFVTLVWPIIYGWQVVENKSLVPKLPLKTFEN